MARLLCTVRGCREELRDRGRSLVCSRNHTFDRARSGYVNLLQPTDRRSNRPGDAKAAVEARRRLLVAGYEEPILDRIAQVIADAGLGRRPTALDLGCGEGTVLARVSAACDLDATGLEISVPAVDLAARAYPEIQWIVANADRELPFADGSFDLVTSITSRRNASEFRRVLAPGGALVVVVPAADDLVEVREALGGQRVERDRVDATIAELAEDFAFVSRTLARTTARLDASAIRDVLAATYRGGRFSERDRLSEVDHLDVTLSRDILRLAAR